MLKSYFLLILVHALISSQMAEPLTERDKKASPEREDNVRAEREDMSSERKEKLPVNNEPVVPRDSVDISPTSSNSVEKSYRFLLCPIMMKSHADDVAVVAVELSRRGHRVHFLLGDTFPIPARINKHNLKNVDNPVVVEFYERPSLDEDLDFDRVIQSMVDFYLEDRKDLSFVIDKINRATSKECERLTMHNERMFSKFASLNFDMVIIDVIPVVRCLLLVPHRLKLPWIVMTDLVEPSVVRVPYLPSFVPAFFTDYTDEMTFLDRVVNTATAIVQHVFHLPEPAASILDKYRQYGDFESLKQLSLNTLFWITSRDVTLDYVKPSMPNMVDAGGLTVEPASSQLEESVVRFVSKAKKGVIVVSFGSGAFSLPKVIKDKFISAFEAVEDFNFLWRVRADVGDLYPSNVMRFDWLPQNQLLALNSTKAFITHCGNNGQFEALYHSVPMIGFPLTGDQPYNARRVFKKGFGIQMDVHQFTAKQLVDAINTVTQDGGYKARISKASRIWRAAAQRPAERAAYWVEHVTKFGADHLKSDAAVDMSIFQLYSFDVFALFSLVAVVVVFALWRLVGCVGGRLRRKLKQN